MGSVRGPGVAVVELDEVDFNVGAEVVEAGRETSGLERARRVARSSQAASVSSAACLLVGSVRVVEIGTVLRGGVVERSDGMWMEAVDELREREDR